jgi:hypothetical protein
MKGRLAATLKVIDKPEKPVVSCATLNARSGHSLDGFTLQSGD